MTEWRLVRVAVWREIYSRRKVFFVTTAIAVILVVGGLVTAAIVIDATGTPTVTVGVVGQYGAELEQAIEQRLDPETEFRLDRFDNQSEGEEALRAESIDALVTGPRQVLWGPTTSSGVADTVASAMRSVHIGEVSADLGLEPEEVTRLLAPVNGRTIDFEERDETIQLLAVVSVIVMFAAIIAYGQWIAYSVVEEKANRVAELVLGALSPVQLLTAKMISLGGMGLAQLVMVGAAGVVAGTLLTDIALPPVAGSTLAWLLLWFLLGYVFYGSLYAAAGSLAADSQEAGSVIGPLNILPGLGYGVGVISFAVGAETLAQVLSMIPFWAPLIMPGRMAQGAVEWWEVALAIIAMLLATFAMVRLAARVYLGGITQATRTVGWRQAFQGGRDLGSK